MDDSNNFELIFKKNSANRPLALYNTTNVVNNSSIKPRDVLNSVYSQIRTIQLADGSSSKVVGKLLNGVKRSSFLAVNKLPVDNEVPHQTNRFETQCVSDTQLINVIEDAEAIINANKGMTQEFNTTFAHTNIGDRNSDVTLSLEKIDRENNEQLKIEELETIYTQSNVDETVLLHDTMEKDVYNETDHTQLDNIMELNRDVFELTSVGTLREMCDKVIKQNKSSEISVLHSDKCIENHCREVSRKLKDRDSQNIDPIHTETENEGKKKDNVIEANHTINLNNSMEFNNIDEERSPSPVLKMKTKCKITKMATPLVVSLESFEKFERRVLPHIDINEDDDICKHLINSQILGGELCLNTNEEVLFNRRGNLSPIIERISDIVAEKLIVINRSTDEILFSSDEETDYINKELKDLPVTAALETSFDDHSNVSEETMYVGFQTASNKSIQIYTESLQKAQHIFDEDENIDGTDFSLTELVDICDKKNLKHLSSPDLKVRDKIYSKVKAEESKSVMNKDSDITQSKLNDSTEHHKMIEVLKIKVPAVTDYDDTIKKPPEKQNFVGFKTASNKRIDLSDKALELGKKVFVDFDISEKFDSVDQHYLEPISEEAYVEAKVIVETYLSKNDPENDIDDKITDDMIIQEFENIEMSLEEKEQLDQMNRKCTEKILLPNSSQSNCKPEVTTFIGFKTANNKNIKISAQALAKTKIIFHDIDSENDKPVDDLEQKYDIQAADYLNQSSRSETAFAGFKTANVKDIQISEVALSKSSKTFMDIDSESPKKSEKYVENRNKIFEGFKTASNKRVDVSEQALLKSRKIFQEMEDGTKNCNDISSFSGIKTANNKAVTFTEESIARSKKLFEDFGTIMYQNPHDLPCKNDPKDHNPTFKGFQTANKKPITVSVLALERSKKIFQDIDDSVSKTNTISESPFKGFQTASNKDVVVTKEALDASKKLLDKFKIDDSTCSFVGFKTASNKKIDISEEALAKCKKIFDDMDDLPTENLIIKATSTKSFGFQTANNKKVKISKKALEKTKTLFNDIEFQEQGNFKGFQTEESTKPFGFQTANNKQVQITKEALQNTKTLFNDIEFQEQGAFKGFQTASKKKVEVSKEAIEKSKAIFNDIELSDFKEQEFISVSHTTKKPDEVDENIDLEKHGGKLSGKSIFCFQMANFNTNLSKDAMKYSKNLLEDTSYNENKTSIDDICDRNTFIDRQIDSGNLESIINTQVLNNFEETLCTEDFKDSQRNSKRAGSPILFCPRAKRRKRFETPYKADNDKKSQDCIKNIATKNTTTPMIKFGENYKKNKICTLKDLTKFDSHGGKYIDPYIFNFNLDNILNFEFVSQRNEVTDNKISVEDIKNIFLKAVNRNLVPEGWLDNHLKLILWKLISYEIKFPDLSFLCTVQNVIDQLKYRYDKELYNAERPALRKIFEKDDVPTKTMVLCVAGIFIDGVSVSSVASSETIELLLTDGWYFIKATIDKMLRRLVCDGRIVVGCKIVTSGAELANCEQGLAPWEDTSAVRLKLFGNSTRPARWHAKLGYTRAAILSHLSSVKVDGGKISRLRVFAARLYPLLYVEKFEDGSTVTRSERLELLHQIKYEAERELMMERIYEEVQKEFSDQESEDSEIQCSGKRKYLETGSQIAKMMKRSKDPMEFRAHLTSSQVQLLQDHTCKYRERALQAIQDRIQERVARRNVVTVARVRVAGVQDGGRLEITKGMLSIWKPNDAILELFKEGSWVEIMNVVPTAIRYSEIQISAGRQSVFRPTNSEKELLPHLQSLTRTCFKISDVAQNPSMTTDYNEIDTVGIVFLIEPSNREFESNKNFQNVYLADPDKNIICVNFWGGLKKFGYENILDTGQIVACANLQKRAGNTRKNIPQFRVTEFTFFTKTPKNVQARKMVEDLNKKLFSLDRRKLCDDCIEIKNNYAAIRCLNNYENESPYRFNKSDYSFARNKMFIDTPLGVKTHKNEDINLNLTGLDFESTFKQITQELSPKELLRKKKVNEKIAKLKMYGEPPRLSPITITNKSENAKKSYKSPLASVKSSVATSNLPTHSVSTINKLPEESPKTTLRNPLNSLNRTCVRNVPVKLNFADENKNDLVDHFAEEFDGSPPLSLD